MSEEPGTRDPDELELNKAAYLSVYDRDPETGKPPTQDKVANRLGTTREQVNRYIQQARQRGILRTEYVPLSDKVLNQVLLDLNHTNIAAVLQDFSEYHRESNGGRSIQSVTVVCDELRYNQRDQWDKGLLRFGPLTVLKTKQFIREAAKLPSPVVGLAWGRILRVVVDAVSASDFKSLRDKGLVQCVPLWGEVWGPEVSEWEGTVFTNRDRLSSSILAKDLEAKLNRREEHRRRHSLEAVPVMLPREMAEHKALLFQYLEKVSAWGEIFGERGGRATGRKEKGGKSGPLVEQMQLVLAGAGSPKNPGRFMMPEVLRNVLSEQETSRLLQAVFGDVGGVLMEKPNLSRDDRRLLDRINTRWTGVREEHLRQCAEKARHNAAVGVVVYAVHKSRSQAILEALRRGVVTHLVTEMGLAVELKRLAEREMEGRHRSKVTGE